MTSPSPTIDCTQSVLSEANLLSYLNGDVIARAAEIIPACRNLLTPDHVVPILARSTVDASSVTVSSTSSMKDPFYASKFPIMYALAATTVTSYMLVIMLFITPRSFLDGGVVYLGRRGGFTSGSTGGVTIGGRPWLQKVAAISVAISLTIASSSTFDVAQRQYAVNELTTKQLQFEVMDGTELKVIRLISDTFLWLAQAQTLIRLFPRHREKVMIKWTAFALIVLDIIFSALDQFKYSNTASSSSRPRTFVDAIPALSYVLQLTLGLLYAAWVIYYAIMKKRYAFYHALMKNMILMAIMSTVAIMIPVVFFIMDLINPEFTGWGDYVRWVGAAAASVVVWEWVERIEALEREEKKDGILGREIFDGDEMIETSSSDYRRRKRSMDDGCSEKWVPQGRSSRRRGFRALADRQRRRLRLGFHKEAIPIKTFDAPPRSDLSTRLSGDRGGSDSGWGGRMGMGTSQTPVSRTETTSAASTMYAVRRAPMGETMESVTEHVATLNGEGSLGRPVDEIVAPLPVVHIGAPSRSISVITPDAHSPASRLSPSDVDLEANLSPSTSSQRRRPWPSLTSIARSTQTSTSRQLTSPKSPTASSVAASSAAHDDISRWDIKGRLEEFAVTQAEKMRDRFRPTNDVGTLPTFEIAAPTRRGVALGEASAELDLEDEEEEMRRVVREQQEALEEFAARRSGERQSPTRDEDIQRGEGASPPMWPGVRDDGRR